MRINNNITALNSHRQYGINNANISKSVEKLSSGYRINRAGDDAAGLAISEKMRAQIRGLNMASKNSQDAISLVQTAEGALQTTHDILRRMSELAVQSASDTNQNAVDRDSINKEFQALMAEIDDTASKTAFNGRKLIDGTFAGSAGTTSYAAGGTVAGTVTVTGGAALTADPTGNITASIAAEPLPAESATVAAAAGGNLGTDTGSHGVTGVTVTLGAGTEGTALDGKTINAFTVADASGGADGSETTISVKVNGVTFTSAVMDLSGGGTADLSGPLELSDSNGNKITLDFATAGNISALNETAVKGIGTDMAGASWAINSDGKAAGHATENVLSLTYNGETKKITDGNDSATFSNGVTVTFDNAFDKANSVASDYEVAISSTATTTGGTGTPLTIQTGANKGDELEIYIQKMDSAALGLSGVDVSNRLNASAAIEKVNDAINSVSSQRADLGALQNRLEFKVQNLDISSENLQSAESRIRDVDMAKQMTDFTKNNILYQASTAMLAQANSLPQGVLQLLG